MKQQKLHPPHPQLLPVVHLRTVDGVTYPNFQTACGGLGLFQEDVECEVCLRDACVDQNASRLRNLFVVLFLFCSRLHPKELWELYLEEMTHDLRHENELNGGRVESARTTPF